MEGGSPSLPVGMRPLPVLVGSSAVGLAVLAFSPLAAAVFGGILLMAGVVVRARVDRATGAGIAATGVALFLAAVLVLALVDTRQQDPVILGPGTGLTPGGP